MEIDKDVLVQKYNSSSEDGKNILIDLFGHEVFNVDIRDKVYDSRTAYSAYRKNNNSNLTGICFGDITQSHCDYLKAICDALVIADALNDGWSLDRSNSSIIKYSVGYCYATSQYYVSSYYSSNNGCVAFRSKELAEYFIDKFPEICEILYKKHLQK